MANRRTVRDRTPEEQHQRNLNFARTYGRTGPINEQHLPVPIDFAAAEIRIARALSEETAGGTGMNLGRLKLKPGDAFVTEAGYLVTYLRVGAVIDDLVFIVNDEHIIEDKKYPAGARWTFDSISGEFMWQDISGRKAAVPGMNISRKWTREDQLRRDKLKEDAFEAAELDVRPVPLQENLPIPEAGQYEKPSLAKRIVRALNRGN